jgi:hypothetical protein
MTGGGGNSVVFTTAGRPAVSNSFTTGNGFRFFFGAAGIGDVLGDGAGSGFGVSANGEGRTEFCATATFTAPVACANSVRTGTLPSVLRSA